MKINFEVSGLEPENPTNALRHYELEFSQPVNADWLIRQIKAIFILQELGTSIDEIVKEASINARANYRIMSR